MRLIEMMARMFSRPIATRYLQHLPPMTISKTAEDGTILLDFRKHPWSHGFLKPTCGRAVFGELVALLEDDHPKFLQNKQVKESKLPKAMAQVPS